MLKLKILILQLPKHCKVNSNVNLAHTEFLLTFAFYYRIYSSARAIESHLLSTLSFIMTNYGINWQSSEKFAADFKAWSDDRADDSSAFFSASALVHWLGLHLETAEELLCEFCVANVVHLSNARVVRAQLQPIVASEGYRFCFTGSKCTRFCVAKCNIKTSTTSGVAQLFVPKSSLALTETVAILVRPHKHQRVSPCS